MATSPRGQVQTQGTMPLASTSSGANGILTGAERAKLQDIGAITESVLASAKNLAAGSSGETIVSLTVPESGTYLIYAYATIHIDNADLISGTSYYFALRVGGSVSGATLAVTEVLVSGPGGFGSNYFGKEINMALNRARVLTGGETLSLQQVNALPAGDAGDYQARNTTMSPSALSPATLLGIVRVA